MKITDRRQQVLCVIREATPQEAHVYDKIRQMHCAKEKGHPECVGELTLKARSMTLRCVLCGDVQATLPETREAP